VNPRRLAHVNLFVSDLEAARRFYGSTCGFREIFAEPAISAAFLSNGNSHHDLGLIEVSKTDRIGRDGKVLIAASQRGSYPSLNHLGFEMESERQLVTAFEGLNDAGIKVSRTVDHGLAHSVYMPDPDGNMLEFYADVIDDWRRFWKENLGNTVTGTWQPQLGSADPNPHYQATFDPDIDPLAPIHALRVTCATLATARLDAMLDFYTKIIGLKVLSGPVGGQAILAGSTGEACLHLVSVREPTSTFGSTGIELRDAASLESAKSYLRSRGHAIQQEEAHPDRASFLTKDPDGFGVWFYASTVQPT